MDYSATLIRAKDRTENTTIEQGGVGQDADQPDYRASSYREQIDDVLLMRSCYGGTKTMRARGEDFLPRQPMEEREPYENRRKQSNAFNALEKTVQGLVGMIFRRDPVLSEDMPQSIQDHMQNVDLRGDAFPIFWRRTGENALLDGHTWVHVETPRRSEEVRTRADEDSAGIRPYWINITKSRAINWRYAVRGGRPVMTLFVYLEGATEPDGAFGERHVDRIRVLREESPGNIIGELWELQEKEGEQKEWVQVDAYRIEVDEIPVIFVAAYRTKDMGESDPPLRDLAYLQIAHYQVESDRRKSMTFSSIAVPWLFGAAVTDSDGRPRIQWGPDGMLVLNDETAKAGILESHGYGLEATKEELEAMKQAMASMGLRMLVQRPSPSPQTATEQLLGKSQDDAGLVVFAKLLEDAANNCLVMHGKYMQEAAPGEVEINRDFHDQLITPDHIRTFSEMQEKGQISLDTLWDILVAGESLPEDFDHEEERERIQSETLLTLTAGEAELFGEEEAEEEAEVQEPALNA